MSSTRCFSLFIFPIAARHLFKASALFALLFSSYGAAIGMSELTVSSAVGERFYGLIGVTGTKDIAADDILVSLAPRSVYRAMDVEWEYFHTRLIFDVLVDEQESYTIRVVSSDIVFEPYLDFVVSLRSPAGSVSKQLTALLEMPAVIVQSKPIKTIKPAKPTIAPKQQHKIQRSPTIQKQKTLNASIRLESDSESKADNSENIEKVGSLNNEDKGEDKGEEKSEEKLNVDRSKPHQILSNQNTAVKSKTTDAEVIQHDTRLNENTSTSDLAKEDSWSYKTRSGDSLWAVARRIHVETGGNIKPIVDALYQNNTRAFIKNNADRLKVNARLSVSAAQISAVIAANQQSGHPSNADSLNTQIKQPISVDTLPVEEEGVLSLVTSDDNSVAVANETVELSERSDDWVNDFDKGLSTNKERELSVEARMDSLHRQYEALAEKTEQLKILEESLNQGVADKPQGFVALDESLPVTVNESANDEVNVQPKTTNKRHLFFIILAAASLLFLLVLLLKRRQLQHRARDIDNWSLDTEPFLSVQPEDSLEPKKSLEQEDSLEQENTPVPEVSAQASDGLGSSLDDSIDHEYGKDDDSDMPPALPAEGAVELEAAVYIAYERFDEAEDLLEQALEIDSDNEALQMQLLEVYAAKGKARHFDLLANQIHNHDNDRIIIKINYLKSKL